ncbi:hypothetical protein GOODEAATRI_020488 [Goodea atripinnis]|uniref:Uncharacterized protein n=1 Tax=Goodea atripinnis TaxID=208336 RepID=A0ABV0NEJ6_9TELE
MQGSSVPKTPSEAQVALNEHQVLPNNVNTDTMHTPFCGPVSSKTEGQRTHTTPQSGTTSALVTIKRATGFGVTPAPMESEEERAAKRREHWRVKKREQRAKLAAQITKARERTLSRDRTFQGLTAQKTRLVANPALSNSQPFLRGAGQKQTPVRVKVPYTTATLETNKHQSGLALTLTHLQSPQNAASATGSNFGGCVMKMNISSRKPTLSVLSVGQKLTEEERMAKKREYWRTKKREQRAARAFRLKHSIFQARTSAAVLIRKAQTQESSNTVQPSTNFTHCTEKAQYFLSNNVPAIPQANEIKQEGESLPAADLNSLPDQAICLDIKPPTSPLAPPVPQPELQPSLNADSQATTLLAVASMKKLLEESLCTVTENQVEQVGLVIETTEDASKQDIEPILSQLYCEKDNKALVGACLTSQTKTLESDSDVLKGKDLPNPQLKDLSQNSEAVPPLSTSGEVVHSTCDQSCQTPSTAFISTASSCRTQRSYSKYTAHQNCCSYEPPQLQNITTTCLDPSQLHHLDQQSQCHNSHAPSTETNRSSMTRQSSSSSLEKKREYWKLMKRQQRARLKTRQKDLSKNTQTAGLNINDIKCVNATKPSIQSTSPVTSVAAVSSIPEVLVVTTCKAEQSPDALQVKLPIISTEGNVSDGTSSHLTDFAGESSQHCQKWTPRTTETDTASSLPTLKPPDNPLSAIHLHPIECGIIKHHDASKTHPWGVGGGLPEEKARVLEVKKEGTKSKEGISGKGTRPNESFQQQQQHPACPGSTNTDKSYAGEADFLFAHYDDNDDEDTMSEAVWRNRYLMDYDPLNQLLVCMRN